MKVRLGDMVYTTDSDLGIVKEIRGTKLLIDNNVNEYEINLSDVTEKV